MKKVVYIVKSLLHIYPPCIAQIRMLKQNGVNVEVWYGSCSDELLKLFDREEIPYQDLHEVRGRFSGKLDKLNNWLDFRNQVRKRITETDDKKDTLFWFGTAESAIPLVGKLKGINYALTALELMDDDSFKRNMFGRLTGDAKFIVCCEETRAYIMRYWYRLPKLPYVMPNKPYAFDRQKRKAPSCEATQRAVEMIKDKRFIIFQGILHNREYLIEMAHALKESGSPYYFVLMGRDPEQIFPEVKNEYEKTLFIENIPAPFHLEVTSYADIGFVFYDENTTLNQAFCAPNKIYEYSGLGIPAVGNMVPGLVNTIGASNAGICCEMKKEPILAAIKKIEANYAFYASNALVFYEKTDNYQVMRRIIEDSKLLD